MVIEKRVYEIKGEQSLLVGIPDVSIQRHPTPRNSSTSVVRDRIKIKETGFFAVFGWCIDILGKNPVSGHTQNQRNRVFAVFWWCIDVVGKNPVSQTTHHITEQQEKLA
ncbi:MAG: hypothetical protein EAZ09_15185 [Oscillatoriales cyanobacterium]|nr:MAG: hypothetical protein EAZ18_14415 [Oscillatoriales cyanobacterium]TAH20007.1 MAG: hypothetical protein EAZ09_15185 [Oscillatoriales cyanobacterium]